MSEETTRGRSRSTGAGATSRRSSAAAGASAAAPGAASGAAAGAAKASPAKSASAGDGRPASARKADATIRFLPDWREEVTGELRAGGRLRVEYASDRLPGEAGKRSAKEQGVVAEVRFSPGEQHHSGRVVGGKFEIDVPPDASEITIWFHRADTGSWDSRFGENYRFPVATGSGDGDGKSAAGATGRRTSRRAASAG